MPTGKRIFSGAALAIAMAGAAFAEDLPEISITAVGVNQHSLASTENEQPFWNEVIPEASGGNVSVTFAPMDIMGIKGDQVMSMTQLGVVDFGASDISKMAGQNPLFEGCDLAGLALDIETARAACEAWLPVMSAAAEEQFNIKLLALGANPPQVIWCNDPLEGLADLAGRKVRVFNKTMTDFVEAAGATAVSIAYAEVVPALQRGVVDCAVTGSGSGNTAGWWEVATHQFQVYLGWAINFQSVNLDRWNSFTPETQAFFTGQFDQLSDDLWTVAAMSVNDADYCNFGTGECKLGKVANPPMVNVPVSDADRAQHAEIMQNVVLLEWARRAGRDNAEKWNETVGNVVGLEIPLDQM
ncbi:hypothetical protein AB838_22080 [Rhodobacteraceae bacterium (ex Bugula neritina AB1)]|nr:hypothetical protein AB838_22080 [Rhodobacteraceae bacterium (ex Bugula neritina AB1)]